MNLDFIVSSFESMALLGLFCGLYMALSGEGLYWIWVMPGMAILAELITGALATLLVALLVGIGWVLSVIFGILGLTY